eukprot:507260-Rhodomonas_salina.1
MLLGVIIFGALLAEVQVSPLCPTRVFVPRNHVPTVSACPYTNQPRIDIPTQVLNGVKNATRILISMQVLSGAYDATRPAWEKCGEPPTTFQVLGSRVQGRMRGPGSRVEGRGSRVGGLDVGSLWRRGGCLAQQQGQRQPQHRQGPRE